MQIYTGPFPNQENNTPRVDYDALPKTGRESFENETPAEYEERMDQAQKVAQFAYLHASVECVKGIHRPAMCVFACAHCHEQDPVHPDGIIFSPFKYYLCMTCYKKHMLRKLDLPHVLKATCNQCILIECARIKLIDPTKVRDFAKHGVY